MQVLKKFNTTPIITAAKQLEKKIYSMLVMGNWGYEN